MKRRASVSQGSPLAFSAASLDFSMRVTLLACYITSTFKNLNCTFPNTIDGTAKFKFILIGYINKNDSNEIAIVACKPKKKVFPIFEGNMYIYTHNPRIARLKG